MEDSLHDCHGIYCRYVYSNVRMTSRRSSDAAVGTAHAQTLHANLVSAYAVQCPPLVWAEGGSLVSKQQVGLYRIL